MGSEARGGEVGSEWERGGRKEGGRRPPVKDPTTARVEGRAKMSKDGFLGDLGNTIIFDFYGNVSLQYYFGGVSPSSFLRTFVSRRALTG